MGMPMKRVFPKDESKNILTSVAFVKPKSRPSPTLTSPASRHEKSPTRTKTMSEKSKLK